MSHPYLRPGALVGHVVVLAASLTCLRLGWWQWGVFEAARGTGQNLGYAMLWPVFAGSFIYMWLRFLHLENDRRTAEALYLDEEPAAIDDEAPRLAADDVIDGQASGTTGPAVDADQLPRPAAGRERRHPAQHHSDAFTVGLGYIPEDDEDDPELAAYNRALAQLAEEDERRA